MAVLTNVTQVADYFRQLTDDPDLGFLSDVLAQTWLQIGYSHYYQFIVDSDPERHVAAHTMTLTNAVEFDLNGILLGPAAPNRMLQLIRVVKLNSAGNQPSSFLLPVSSREELSTYTPDASGWVTGKVLLSNTKLYFNYEQTGDYAIEYIPVPTVDWTKTAPVDTEWIDDLIPWHDMIALYAALNYRAADNAPNEEIAQLLQVRQKQFLAHLQRGRNINASRFVHVEDPWL